MTCSRWSNLRLHSFLISSSPCKSMKQRHTHPITTCYQVLAQICSLKNRHFPKDFIQMRPSFIVSATEFHCTMRKLHNVPVQRKYLKYSKTFLIFSFPCLLVWRPCLISGKSPYKELLPILCLVWPASMWCRRSHGWASQHAGKEPRWCSGSACCLRGVDSRTSPPPPASRGVLQTSPCYVSYHVKYKYSNNYVSLLSSQRIMMDSQPSLDPTFFPIPSWSWLKRPGSISIHVASNNWGRSHVSLYPCDNTFQSFFSCNVILFPSFYLHGGRVCACKDRQCSILFHHRQRFQFFCIYHAGGDYKDA